MWEYAHILSICALLVFSTEAKMIAKANRCIVMVSLIIMLIQLFLLGITRPQRQLNDR